MAVVTKEFHRHERGMGDEHWYRLARDTETGRVYIQHEWSVRDGGGYTSGESEMSIAEFLGTGGGTRQDKLLALIGTLVPVEGKN